MVNGGVSMNEEFKKEIQREILRQISLPNLHQNELKDIMIDFDKALEKVSKMTKDLQDETARMFLALLLKYGLIRI